jgi:hypothetical protein
MRPNLYVADDRYVLTYEVEGWPVGVITGVLRPEVPAFYMEHMILFTGQPPMYLLQMLAAALQHAWARKMKMVVFTIQEGQPHAEQLRRLARRHGFEQGLNESTWYITERMAT